MINKKLLTKELFKNIIPTMISFTFTGVYSIVDGIFVGQNTGEIGLAAVGIAFPFTALLMAVSTGIGMSGSIHIGIAKGQHDEDRENKILSHIIMLLFIAAIILITLMYFTLPSVFVAFGAKGTLLKYADDYMKILVLGGIFQILSTGLISIVRNYDGPLISMTSMIIGFSTNVVLDWYFISILKWGVAGAALATIIGQAFSLVPLIIYLLIKVKIQNKIKFIFDKSITKTIIKTGFSPFGMALIPNFALIIMNKGALINGGELAVSSYTMIEYIIAIMQLLLQGIGDGAQPLISKYFGASKQDELKYLKQKTYIVAFITAVIGSSLIYLLRMNIILLYGVSNDVAILFLEGLIYFIIGILFMSFTRITISYLYATNNLKIASLIIYGEPLVLFLLVLFILPNFLGLTGVWISIPITQIIMILFYKIKKNDL